MTRAYRTPIFGGRYHNMTLGFRGMSPDPCHPLWIGQWGEIAAHDLAALRYRQRPARWSDLPEPVKALVRRDCAE